MYIVLGVCEIKQLQCESNGPGSLLYSTASVCYMNTKGGSPRMYLGFTKADSRYFPLHYV